VLLAAFDQYQSCGNAKVQRIDTSAQDRLSEILSEMSGAASGYTDIDHRSARRVGIFRLDNLEQRLAGKIPDLFTVCFDHALQFRIRPRGLNTTALLLSSGGLFRRWSCTTSEDDFSFKHPPSNLNTELVSVYLAVKVTAHSSPVRDC
jgi:hypothetical protein